MPARPLFDIPSEASAPLSRRTLSCPSCGLYKAVTSPKMPPYGRFKRGLMTIGEGPGADEDRLGKPWQGRTGRLLSEALSGMGIELERDALSLNAVNCRPTDDKGNNREPSEHELACCRAQVVFPAIERERPKVILLMGGSATSSVLGSLTPDLDGRINKWRGWQIPVPEWGAWVCPTFHPSYVAREDGRPEIDTVWRQDLKAAVGLLDRPAPPSTASLRDRVTLLRSEEAILTTIAKAHEAECLSFDYETTGLRARLHKLVCASFATSADRAYAFMWRGSERVKEAWHGLLSDDRVGKVSHNLKFEDQWSREHVGVERIRWEWDGMLAAHVYDNRPGLCGLKLQAFLNFGIRPYDGKISPFLKAKDHADPHSANTIYDFIARYGEEEALIYCGLDSLIEFMLMERQKALVGT